MRPACDEGHAIEANDQKVALVVFISLPLQPIRELMQHLLPSNWLKVTQLCFVNTVLHRAFLVGFCFYPSRCILLSCCVRSVTYNEFKDQKVLFVEICFMYLWCFLFFEALTKTAPSSLGNERTRVFNNCLPTLETFQRSRCKVVIVCPVKLFAVKAFNILCVSLM